MNVRPFLIAKGIASPPGILNLTLLNGMTKGGTRGGVGQDGNRGIGRGPAEAESLYQTPGLPDQGLPEGAAARALATITIRPALQGEDMAAAMAEATWDPKGPIQRPGIELFLA